METLMGLLPETAEGWTAAFTGGLFVTAVLTAWYARRQWSGSRKHHKEQIKAQAEAIRPYVLVTVETSKAASNLFDLVIRNLGKRPAVEVEITLDPPPVRASEMREPGRSRWRTLSCSTSPCPFSHLSRRPAPSMTTISIARSALTCP